MSAMTIHWESTMSKPSFSKHPAPKRVFTAIAVSLLSGTLASAGWDAPGSLKDVQQVRLASLDIQGLLVEDEARSRNGMPPRFAIPHEVSITPDNAGNWAALDADTSLWRLRVSSRNAVNINLGFTGFELPRGAELVVYGADGAEELRPFTEADNAAHGQLWTPPIDSDEVIIELTVPNKVMNEFILELGSINIGYKEFGTPSAAGRSGSCNIDVVCPEGDPHADIISTVAVISTGGSTFCTGFMVNNALQDRTPYFMTANHCGIDAGNAASLVTFWNFENTTCRTPGSSASGGAGDGSLDQFLTGSLFLASNSASDMTIVLLDETPPADWEVGYAGWDRRDIVHAGAIAVHHPNTDEKRISFEGDDVVATDYLSDTPPGSATHYWVSSWDEGTTEPGSSGSPLFSPEGRVIGQLHGGFASCTDFRGDWYGRVFVSWDNGAADNSLNVWLDPFDSGIEVLDTIPGRGATLDPSAEVVSKGVIGGPFTNTSTVYTLDNSGTAPLDFNVSLANGATAPVILSGQTSGSVPVGADITFNVDIDNAAAAALAQGIYTATVEVEDITNGLTLTRDIRLEVGQTGFTIDGPSFVYGSGPVGGPFTGEQVFTITSTQPSPVQVEFDTTIGWAQITRGKSTEVITLNGEGDSETVTIGFSDQAAQLPAGLVNGEVTVTNLSQAGVGDTTIPVTLDVGRFVIPSADTPLPISDNTAFTSEVVFNESFCVGDVDVSVDITHTYIGDLRITLTSPDGVTVTLHDRTGGSSDDINETWDDATNVPDGPGSLSSFNEGESMGTWTLEISDNAGADTGTLNSWSLELASAGEECPPSTEVVVYDFPLDTDPQWSMDSGWAFGVPQGGTGSSSNDNGDPNGSGATGSNVLGYALGAADAGGYENNMSERYLTSEALDLTNVTQAVLQFQRWLAIESSTFDGAAVEISADDGATWSSVWSHEGGSLSGGAWERVEYNISALDGASNARIRWVMGSTDSSVTYSGWNIDDIQIIGNLPAVECPEDISGDGAVDITDLLQLLAVYDTADADSDITGDGQVDISDLLQLLTVYGTECP